MLSFENVGLSYGMGPETLRDLTFSIEPDSFQFLTGPSGAGKTSLLKLILLSLKPTRGEITLFGEDAATLGKSAITQIRRRIGVVFQDFRLLDHLTLYENVALPLRVLGRDETGYRAEVFELLRWVGLFDRKFVRPTVLSGGEKQRVALARLLLKAPHLVVLDEATAHLDAESEAAVQRALDETMHDRTSIVIAHRLSTIRNADQILVIDAGRVVERGTHAELHARPGLYRDLYETQFAHQED